MGEDNSAILGAMMVTKIQLAAMGRADTPEPDRRPFLPICGRIPKLCYGFFCRNFEPGP